jgi:hypothetical protein
LGKEGFWSKNVMDFWSLKMISSCFKTIVGDLRWQILPVIHTYSSEKSMKYLKLSWKFVELLKRNLEKTDRIWTFDRHCILHCYTTCNTACSTFALFALQTNELTTDSSYHASSILLLSHTSRNPLRFPSKSPSKLHFSWHRLCKQKIHRRLKSIKLINIVREFLRAKLFCERRKLPIISVVLTLVGD